MRGFTGPQPGLLDALGVERDDQVRVRHRACAARAPPTTGWRRGRGDVVVAQR
ncbi:MAG: hypothetical protein M3R46_09415 [Actinomycetota bacterium]|nr:hypothetical protein [Actinomycetota bacterium]